MAGKLSYLNVDKVIKKCSSKEIDFMLYLSSISNEFGSIRGLHYNDVSSILNINQSTFYRIIDNLISKALITCDFCNGWGSWNLTINNNIFRNKEDYKAGYMNTNYDFLYGKEYQDLPLQAKRLVLMLLKVQGISKHYKVGVESLKRWTLTDSSWKVIKYLKTIEVWFNIQEKNGLYIFSVKNKTIKSKTSNDEKEIAQKIISFCKSYSIEYTLETLKDLIIMFKQYGYRYDPGDNSRCFIHNKFIEALSRTIIKHRSIEPKLINYIVSKA